MVAAPRLPAELSELSSIIGELRSFAAQQQVTNAHVIEQLKSISDRIASIGETGVILQEYRNTLHERFNRIHEMLGNADERVTNHEVSIQKMLMQQTAWASNLKMVIAIGWVAGTIASAILVNFGGAILRQMLH
jgi:Holliday junction resolvasome RuvABC endonuclease subunit